MYDEYTPEKVEFPISSVAKYVEYTNLKSMKSKDIEKFVQTANNKGYVGVCLQPGDLAVAKKVRRPDLKLVTVVGFPPIHTFSLFKDPTKRNLQLALGLYRKSDIEDIRWLIETDLSDELDVVFPIYWYVTGQFVRIHKFLKGIKDQYKKPVKVITELGTIFNKGIPLYEILDLLKQSGVDYFKTNTGLIPQKDANSLKLAIVHLKMLMADMDIEMPIKASGGIRSLEQAVELVNMGVQRIGTSSII
jgi:deoxyribose-phosphate aldolase